MATPLSEAITTITRGLQGIYGFDNVKKRNQNIWWIVTRDAWLGIRWVHVSYVSGCPTDFIRLRNDIATNLPKNFWRFSKPHITKFELTFHHSELTPAFVMDFNSFVTFLADGRDEIYTWDLFQDGSYPDYGWSLKSEEILRKK